MGSTRVVHLAGIQVDSSATTLNKRDIATKAIGSKVFTPKRKLVRKRVSQKAPPIPITMPISASAMPYRITIIAKIGSLRS